MTILKRRWFAFIILALTVILTVGLSGGRALSASKNEVLSVYINGADGSGLSIANDLRARADSAAEMANIAERNGAKANLINVVREKAQALLETASVKEASRLHGELGSAVGALETALEGAALSESDRTALLKNSEEFLSRGRVIDKDHVYNDKVEAFNETLSGFPANLIARIAGIGPLETF